MVGRESVSVIGRASRGTAGVVAGRGFRVGIEAEAVADRRDDGRDESVIGRRVAEALERLQAGAGDPRGEGSAAIGA